MLRESFHEFDSQTNEAINNMISYYAPKNRCYSATNSLTTRISFAVIVHSVGLLDCIKRLGLNCDPCVKQNAFAIDKKRQYKSDYQKKTDVKRRRSKGAKMKQTERLIQDKRAKQNGTYYSTSTRVADNGPIRKKQQSTVFGETTKKVRTCSACGKTGHRRDNKKICTSHPEYVTTNKKKRNEGINSDCDKIRIAEDSMDQSKTLKNGVESHELEKEAKLLTHDSFSEIRIGMEMMESMAFVDQFNNPTEVSEKERDGSSLSAII